MGKKIVVGMSGGFETMYQDMSEEGLQPVLNDYVYV